MKWEGPELSSTRHLDEDHTIQLTIHDTFLRVTIRVRRRRLFPFVLSLRVF